MKQYKNKFGNIWTVLQELPFYPTFDGPEGESIVVIKDQTGYLCAMPKPQFEKEYTFLWEVPQPGEMYLTGTGQIIEIRDVLCPESKYAEVEVVYLSAPEGNITQLTRNHFITANYRKFTLEDGQQWKSKATGRIYTLTTMPRTVGYVKLNRPANLKPLLHPIEGLFENFTYVPEQEE